MTLEHVAATKLNALTNLANRYVANREDAEDVVQDALCNAHRKLHLFRGDSSLLTWVSSIVINFAKMHRRKLARVRLSPEAEQALFTSLCDAANPELILLERSRCAWLADAIGALPELLRAPLELRMRGLTEKEIAAALGRRVGTIKAQLSRAKAAILARKADA